MRKVALALMFAFVLFSGIAFCAGVNAAAPQKVAGHIALSASAAEAATNETGITNAGIVAIGGSIAVVLFIAFILINTLRKRKKKGIQ